MVSSHGISVVVPVLNGALTLNRCIESILSQDLACQLVVMDGGSTDATISILKEHEKRIAYWESTSDKGISDAWNKALRTVSGDWVCFLGADDYFSHSASLSRMIERAATPRVNFISSKVAWVNSNGDWVRVIGEPWDWERMKYHQVIAHRGALHHRSLFEQHGIFDTRYRIAGDYDFLLRAGPRIVAGFVDAVTVCAGINGVSLTNVRCVLNETRMIQSSHAEIGRYRAYRNFMVAHVKHFVRRVLL